MASLWEVPLVLICENNYISQTTPSGLNLSSNIEKRANAFEIDYCLLKIGSTVSEINKILKPKFDKVRNYCKPLIVEFQTNRLAAHSKGDDTRSKIEIERLHLNDWYYKLNNINSIQLQNIEKKIKGEVDILIKDILERENTRRIELKSSSLSIKNILNNNQRDEKVLNNLNRALHSFMNSDKNSYFIGEDINDPYGGAFKVSSGLSTSFPKRTISTPISELGIAGVGNGLALCGNKVIVEFMFADFTFLAFDQIINFAVKTRTMYGKLIDHSILFRCPVGGHRGYGATHSQSIQKFFIGIPNLDLYELSPLHDLTKILPKIMDNGNPSMLFESKTLYPQKMFNSQKHNNIFHHKKLNQITSHIFIEENIDALIICAGGQVFDCLDVAEKLFFESELSVHIINPFKIYPFDLNLISQFINPQTPVFVVEESTRGGTWFSEISSLINSTFDEKIICDSICSLDEIIPSSKHLEENVLVNKEKIYDYIVKKTAL